MKNVKAIFLSTLVIALAVLISLPSNAQDYKYETVEGDPMKARIYTLKNGLKVFLSVNQDEPRIYTNIAVAAGSKHDPSDATGLAHYLEHMLFKGTPELATTNWTEEKKLLDQISALYEENRATKDEAKRKEIYTKIDKLSYEAAKFAVPNEYDKMISSIGAKGTNAYTSVEQTVYVNDIPANEISKWLALESERMSALVLRLFHTELETVYEEFNRGQDSDGRKAWQMLNKKMFQNHPYGTQTTIGTGEHLKNPSMVKIHEYFDTYYVPNNMAICMAGDLDFDKTIKQIDKYFGGFKTKDVPKFKYSAEAAITTPIEADVLGSQPDFIQMGYRFGGVHTEDPVYLDVISSMLSNGQAGLMDLNLVQKQKLLNGGAGVNTMKDYSAFMLSGSPRQGQTLEEVRDLMLAELENIKNGKFDDWLIDAVIKDIKLSQEKYYTRNDVRVSMMTDAFVTGQKWEDVVNYNDKLSKLTKQDIINFAKERFGKNYVAIYKRKGEDPSTFKVDKPKITQLDIERNEESAFHKKWKEMNSSRLTPLFVDFDKSISKGKLSSGIPVSNIENTTNNIFSLYYILDMGSDHDQKLANAFNYLPYLGTDKMSAEDIQKEFYKMGLSFDVFSSRDQVYVYLTGLEESFDGGVKLFEEVLANVKPNDQALKMMVQGNLKSRENGKLRKGNIFFGGMMNLAKFGSKNPFNHVLSKEELEGIKSQELVDRIKSINSYNHQVFYYGKKKTKEVTAILDKYHKSPAKLKPYPKPVEFKEQPITETKVYFVDYDMVQSEVMMIARDVKFDKSIMAKSKIFNEYFGSGLSSIVFQEIREAKALAYTAYSAYGTPSKKENSHYVTAYVGTQTDKLKDATAAIMALMNDMPEAELQFQSAKDAALKKIESDRITKSSVFWNYQSAKKKGLDYDIRKDIYEEIKNMTLADLKAFFNKHIKGKPYTYLVIGKKGDVDQEVLKSIGPVQEMTLEQLFGY
jgi:zinc protease